MLIKEGEKYYHVTASEEGIRYNQKYHSRKQAVKYAGVKKVSKKINWN
jgi:hypothetical protein